MSSDTQPTDYDSHRIFDIHVHYIDEPDGRDIIIGSRQRRHPFTWMLRGLQKISGAESYPSIIRRELSQCRHDYVVLLAMDGCYRNGKLDESRTSFFISNELIAKVANDTPKALFGASVNPMRPDALEELQKCIEAGAVLIKWLPLSQGFDPAEKCIEPFYAKCREYGIPLLVHTGPEFAVTANSPALSDPGILIPALEAGVTVIAAHAALGASVFGNPRKGQFGVFKTMLAKYPNLYGDTAALFGMVRFRHISVLTEDPLVLSRLVNGSDFPVLQMPFLAAPKLGIRKVRQISRLPSYLDRDCELKVALGLSSTLSKAGQILRMTNGE